MSRKHLKYLLLLLLVLTGCSDSMQQELQKWSVTLDHKDKRPYGTYLAYESLKYYFPGADVETLSTGFRYNNIEYSSSQIGHSLLVLEGLNFNLSDEEWNYLKSFMAGGNEVIIFCSSLDERMESELNCYKAPEDEETPLFNKYFVNTPPKSNKDILSTYTDTLTRYGYEGHTIRGSFYRKEKNPANTKPAETTTTGQADAVDSNADTASIAAYTGKHAADGDIRDNDADSADVDSSDAAMDTLGYARRKANFVRFTVGQGHLTLHAAPLVLSNYFLLQGNNKDYLTAIWQSLPPNITHIYWNEYFRRSSHTSTRSVLWRYPSTRWAIILALILLALYILFEGKRKQRIIPIVAPLKNDSVSFVETVGRLYYNKGNNANLASKMVVQFLEWVRMHYLLNTNLLNENFIYQLTMKSGEPEATVRQLLEMIHEVRLGSAIVDDAYLYQLYNTIQQFYKNHRK